MHSVECWGLTLRGQIDYCICGCGPSRAEDERVQELESQLKTLQEKLEKTKEALRFYADCERNANSDGAFKIPEGEQDPFGDGLDFGAKARTALAYIEEGKE